MESALTGLLVITLLIIVVMTLAYTFLQVQQVAFTSFREMQDMLHERAHTDVSLVQAETLSGGSIVELTVRNDGDTRLADFQDWDVIAQYDTSTSDHIIEWLPYNDPTMDRRWKVKAIYQDADSAQAEHFEPNILNPGEEVIMQVWLSPTVGITTTNLLTICTPQGITSSGVFTR